MMGQGTGEVVQVLYIEIEGIKIAMQLTKDAVRVAYQMMKFIMATLKDAPYMKKNGRTNVKNLKARANGQQLRPYTMDRDAYRLFQKKAAKYGILYHAFSPLDSGKKGSMQILFAENDLPMVQELMEQIKKKMIEKNVKCGMDEKTARQSLDENNRMESMEEFAQNTGVVVPPEVFEQKMKERFGEDYGRNIDFPNQQTVSVDKDKIEGLAEIINMEEYRKKLGQAESVKIPFVYDENLKKSDIVDQTETHVKVKQKDVRKEGWSLVWIPKDRIMPPLGEPVKEGEKRTAYVGKTDSLIVEYPGKDSLPEKIEGRSLEKVKNGTVQDKVSLAKTEDKNITHKVGRGGRKR